MTPVSAGCRKDAEKHAAAMFRFASCSSPQSQLYERKSRPGTLNRVTGVIAKLNRAATSVKAAQTVNEQESM